MFLSTRCIRRCTDRHVNPRASRVIVFPREGAVERGSQELERAGRAVDQLVRVSADRVAVVQHVGTHGAVARDELIRGRNSRRGFVSQEVVSLFVSQVPIFIKGMILLRMSLLT